MIYNLIYRLVKKIITEPFYIILKKLVPALNVMLEIGFSKNQEKKTTSIICTLFWSLCVAQTILGTIQPDWESDLILFFFVLLFCVSVSILMFPLSEIKKI